MEITTYFDIYQYLQTLQLPNNLTTAQQKSFRRQTTHYFIRSNLLFRKNKVKPEEPLKVIKTTELEFILHNLHSDILAGHFEIEGTYNRAKTCYYWPSMYKTIADYVKTCDTCQRQGRPITHESLHPIPVENPYD